MLLYGVNNCTSRRTKHESITPVLIYLHWLPVQYRCQYKILMYAFKALHGKAPRYLEELTTIYKPTRARTRTYGDRRFDTAAATLWNNLPNPLRDI